jgi:POT family proton-dependent oligopeptide transporter
LTLPYQYAFFTGLALLICGNGFFKPNISTIVGSLYPKGSPKRDGGFTIFYMGINLGAAMSPLLCGYIGENYGWSYGFGLATIGMLVGLTVFVAPSRVAQAVIALGAIAAASGLFFIGGDNWLSMGANIFVGVALLVSASVAVAALARGGIPANAGAAKDPGKLRKAVLGPIPAECMVYLGTVAAVAAFVLLVSGFAPLRESQRPMTLIPPAAVEKLKESESVAQRVLGVFTEEISRPAGVVFVIAGLLAAVYILVETFRLDRVPRQRMYVVLILTGFSMPFWAMFEQAGSSINNFTDRNVNRVLAARTIAAEDVGRTLVFRVPWKTADAELASLPLLSQSQLGYRNGDGAMQRQIAEAVRLVERKRDKLKPDEIEQRVNALAKYDVLTMTALNYLRNAAADESAPRESRTVTWKVTPDHVGMAVGGSEVPASAFQAVNPVYILLLGLAFSALWTYLGVRGLEPTTTVKFALGLLQLGLGFVAFWYGTVTADPRGMTAMGWLFLGYLLHTMGELCLSPVGLSMVTRLSPERLVSTVMGIWFLATAFSQVLMAIIAQFTSVGAVIPPPAETVHLYGGLFGVLAVVAVVCAVACFALSPVLNRWMHPETEAGAQPQATA